MLALDYKLMRDLWRLRGQVFAISIVIASGVALLIMSLSTHDSLRETAKAYYERYHFAEIFSGLERAPSRMSKRIAKIPGVRAVQTRIVKFSVLNIEGFEEPVTGQLISIPERGEPLLNKLALQKGRFVYPNQFDEVVISDPFAESHQLDIGDQIEAIINGNKRTLIIVGIALAPEFVYAIGPGALMPDEKRFGILWMGRDALASAYDLDGAFNDISLSLSANTNPDTVIDQLDELIKDYGSIGAIARKDQLSNWFLMSELDQMRTMSILLPTIFLSVAAFLIQMVISRLIATERSEIGLFKAFGYTRFQIAWHYARMVIIITLIGTLMGWVLGIILGRMQTELYSDLYRFPFLYFRPSFATFLTGALVSLVAALFGAMNAVYKAASLTPAVAMLPPSPLSYRKKNNRLTNLLNWLDQPTRIIFRQLGRWPVRSALTSFGIAFSVAVLVMSLQWYDAIDEIIKVNFFDSQRQDITVSLTRAHDNRITYELSRLPGVLQSEPVRVVNAEFHVANRSHRGSLQGILAQSILTPVHDTQRGALTLDSSGLYLGSMLADKLQVNAGDLVNIKILDEHRPEISVYVADIFQTYIGMPAYMSIRSLNKKMKENKKIDLLNLRIDDNSERILLAQLKEMPGISAVSLRKASLTKFSETIEEMLVIYVTLFSGFACALAFGLVYNSTRVTLSERGRELATLRVLGFSKAEISYILLGEVALLTIISLPVGCVLGYGLSLLIVEAFETELYRMALMIKPSTYGVAAIITLSAAALSAFLVRRRIDRLDLIHVLKTRE